MTLTPQYCAIGFIILWVGFIIYVRREKTGDPIIIDSFLALIFSIGAVAGGGLIIVIFATAFGLIT